MEVYKKREIEGSFNVILGLNPIGQVLCRRLFDEMDFETVLVFNSPQFTTWNRYPADIKPPVVPVQGMVSDDLMIVFGDIMIKDYEWVTDMLFYLRGNVPVRMLIAFMTHEGLTCGTVLSSMGERMLGKMAMARGHADFYDGLVGPLMSLGNVADLDTLVVFLEHGLEREVVLQVDELSVSQDEVDRAYAIVSKGLELG